MNRSQLESFDQIKLKRGGIHGMIMGIANNRGYEGFTTAELCRIMGKPANEISGRITELRQRGLITNSGLRRENLKTGKKVTVWVSFEFSERLKEA